MEALDADCRYLRKTYWILSVLPIGVLSGVQGFMLL
jgi:hypothetical protein